MIQMSKVEDLKDLDINTPSQDFAGDFFGNDYTNEDLPGWGQSDDEKPHWAHSSGLDSDLDLESDDSNSQPHLPYLVL
jgi:hypothetical protein